LVVGFTHETFASAIRKVRKAVPHPSRAKITTAYSTTKVVHSGGRFAAKAGAKAVGYFGNSFNTRIEEEDDDDNLRGECYPDNDMRDVDFDSVDEDSGLQSEDCSESSDSDSAAEKQCAFDCDYGDLEETGGSYVVQYEDGTEVTLEEHEWQCGCDLNADESDGGYYFVYQSDDESDWSDW
jgi:hypothetical protein